MNEEIRPGAAGKGPKSDIEGNDAVFGTQLTRLTVGEATVYVEVADSPSTIEDDDIYTAGAVGTGEIFEEAGKALRECVRIVGEQVSQLGDKAMPAQVSVEFTLSFEAGGKAQLIPVLFTGETKATSGLKVTAVWGNTSPANYGG